MEKTNILYVDDEPLNLEAFKIAFIFDNKFEIITAQSAIEGLRILEMNNNIMAVISDFLMPEMDGLSFLKKVKEHKTEIACFILSGYTKTPEIIRAINDGLVADYIMKPYEKEILEQSLINAINKTTSGKN